MAAGRSGADGGTMMADVVGGAVADAEVPAVVPS